MEGLNVLSMRSEFKTWDDMHLIRFICCFMRMGGAMGAYAQQAKEELDRRRPAYVVSPTEIGKLMLEDAARRSAAHTCSDCGAGYADRPGMKAQCPACGAMPTDARA